MTFRSMKMNLQVTASRHSAAAMAAAAEKMKRIISLLSFEFNSRHKSSKSLRLWLSAREKESLFNANYGGFAFFIILFKRIFSARDTGAYTKLTSFWPWKMWHAYICIHHTHMVNVTQSNVWKFLITSPHIINGNVFMLLQSWYRRKTHMCDIFIRGMACCYSVFVNVSFFLYTLFSNAIHVPSHSNWAQCEEWYHQQQQKKIFR